MFAIATSCEFPAVSVVVPAYCENSVPFSWEALISNSLPEMLNATGTAPCATPPIITVATTATGTAASTIRPLRLLMKLRNFMNPP